MPNVEVPIRTTLAALLFITSGVAYYYAIDVPQLLWIAQSSFTFFIALGPLRWALRTLLALPLPKNAGDNLRNIFVGDWLRWGTAAAQAYLFVRGILSAGPVLAIC